MRVEQGGVSVAPSMDVTLIDAKIRSPRPIDNRVLLISLFAIGLGIVASGIAWSLTKLIGFCTNLFFFHRLSLEFIDPGQAPNWGLWVVFVPVLGGVVVGFMARYGSKAIRGHGIPEAMEQILTNES
ncbi:MAG: chloride channel protein, partial [Proteobacteria bacterium]